MAETKTSTEESDNRNLIHHKNHDDAATERFKDFYAFCSFVLKYEEKMGYDNKIGRFVFDSEQSRTDHYSTTTIERHTVPTDDNNMEIEGEREEKRKQEGHQEEEETDSDSNSSISDEESWDLVTCYCGRPYAGRPMIECSKCLTWVHLYCARIKKTNVPDVFLCQKCKGHNQSRSANSRYKFRI